MIIKILTKNHTAGLLSAVLSLCVFGLVFIIPSTAHAYPKISWGNYVHFAKSYCEPKFTKNDDLVRCAAAYDYGYKNAKGPTYPSGFCNSKYSTITKPKQNQACKEGAETKKNISKGNDSNGDSGGSSSSSGSGGGGGGGGGATTGSDAPGAGNNGVPEEETSEDGIPDNLGADIIAGQVKLTGSDATNAGIDNRSPDNIIAGILNVVYSVSAVIAVLVIVVAGIMYITSDGDAARVAKAKSAIIYSAVGLVIIGSAFIITGIIQNIGM